MRFRTGSIQPECQNDASNIWRRYHRYVELGQVNMQEIVNFEQSQQNVEGRFPIQSDIKTTIFQFVMWQFTRPGIFPSINPPCRSRISTSPHIASKAVDRLSERFIKT